MLAFWFALLPFACHRVGSEGEGGEWPLDMTLDGRRASVEPGGALGWIRTGLELTAEQRAAVLGYLAWNERQRAAVGL
jgi:hypothetical protein